MGEKDQKYVLVKDILNKRFVLFDWGNLFIWEFIGSEVYWNSDMRYYADAVDAVCVKTISLCIYTCTTSTTTVVSQISSYLHFYSNYHATSISDTKAERVRQNQSGIK